MAVRTDGAAVQWPWPFTWTYLPWGRLRGHDYLEAVCMDAVPCIWPPLLFERIYLYGTFERICSHRMFE
jgi:hypothetical protein